MAKNRAATAPKMNQDEQAKQENSETKAQALPTATDTVRVRFKRGHPALAYGIGEVADLPRALYDQHLGEGDFFEATTAADTETEG